MSRNNLYLLLTKLQNKEGTRMDLEYYRTTLEERLRKHLIPYELYIKLKDLENEFYILLDNGQDHHLYEEHLWEEPLDDND